MVTEGYKNTEIGLIPEDWKLDYIKNIAKITTGAKNTEDNVKNGKYPFFVRSQTVERINSYSFDGEGVLTAGDGDIGKIFHYINGKFDYHQRVYLISNFSTSKVVGYYFYLVFSNNFRDRALQMTAKSSVDSVRREMIAEMLIPLPPKPEQLAIATALSDVDALITATEKLIAKKKAIKQGAMQELLKPKDGWEEKSLGEIAVIKDGTHQTPKYVIRGIPFYSVENVTSNDFEHTKFITLEEHLFLTKNYKIEKGDILMTRIGSIGVCKYVNWDVNASFYVSLALLKVKKGVSALFLSHYSEHEDFKKEIDTHSLHFAYPKKINLGQISKVKLYIPTSLKEQEQIATILSDMDAEISLLEQKLEKQKQIKEGMMQNLLTGKIRLVESVKKKVKKPKHNIQINEAVVISFLVHKFGTEEYPLSRFRYTKYSYLLHRQSEKEAFGFDKYAAGPYNPANRYKGAEGIALKNKYITKVQNPKSKKDAFVINENIDGALNYFNEWYGTDIQQWIEQFRFYKNNYLEVLTTVDKAICELVSQKAPVNVQTIKNYIYSIPQWKKKLEKPYFSDDEIQKAIDESKRLFGNK